jgi:hypothetical protein
MVGVDKYHVVRAGVAQPAAAMAVGVNRAPLLVGVGHIVAVAAVAHPFLIVTVYRIENRTARAPADINVVWPRLFSALA